MKTLIYLTLAASAIAAPALSFAQSPITRAQVNAELAQVEHAGYDPSNGENVNYPADIQAAEAKIWAQNASTNSVGGSMAGSSASGSRMANRNHPANQCVGPVSFCDPYVGG
ncbi:DUF4148 domain-containing protein [Paraburkholderia rhizosphaerae]|uniref:Uncharacterized protein DUF4148 n=1 Tax=Paraburkholderia rhizosphaerae TaxID=480658 RepID=A0A4R8LZK8_9BURK|nr:DUF4148 domain-containing protein [Paraburkholderia rhizosphaerae]TDY52321.1 uncharacterized protein DUF4148 [Paraburkholderia rhizosphaerae]